LFLVRHNRKRDGAVQGGAGPWGEVLQKGGGKFYFFGKKKKKTQRRGRGPFVSGKTFPGGGKRKPGKEGGGRLISGKGNEWGGGESPDVKRGKPVAGKEGVKGGLIPPGKKSDFFRGGRRPGRGARD